MDNLTEIKNLRTLYEFYEAELNETPHGNHKQIVSILKKIGEIEKKLNANYRKIEKQIIRTINSLDLKEITEIQEKIDIGIKKFSIRFIERATVLAQTMIRNNVRGNQLNQLLEAMRSLGYDIGDLEKAAGRALIKEGKVKKFKDATQSCIYINLALIGIDG